MSELKNIKKIEQGRRLREFRDFLNKTQLDFAQQIKLDRAYLAQIETGVKSLSHNVLTNVTNSYKSVNIDWLLNGDGTMIKGENLEIIKQEEDIPNVRFLNIAAQAGIGVGSQIVEYSKWVFIPGLERNGNYFALVVDGKSMMPTLRHGDMIICEEVQNLQEDFEDNQIYVIVSRHEILVKRIALAKDSLLLISDNPMFEATSITFTEVVKLYAVITRVTVLKR